MSRSDCIDRTRAAATLTPDQTAVLGANASGGDTPKSATAARRASGSLPFTGTQLAFILIAAAVALLGGLALRRRLSSQS